MSSARKPKVSIIIKALNEELHIAPCLEAAVREAKALSGEVVLVDSLSTDHTVAIAQRYPVRIVQFNNIEDRGCGAAVQLGYQYALGDFIYVLDADMVLQPGFLKIALEMLEADPGLAGVGGKLVDNQILTVVDQNRVMVSAGLHQTEEQDELEGGGLYRRTAIETVGYLAHRWLPAFEESELGIRLRSYGWRLKRLPQTSVTHTGHHENNWQMLARLWKNNRAQAVGIYLRAACGRKWWWRACRKQWYVLVTITLHSLALLIAMLGMYFGFGGLQTFLLVDMWLWLCVWLGMTFIKRSVALGAYSIVMWQFFAIAMKKVFWRIPDPMRPIPAIELTRPPS